MKIKKIAIKNFRSFGSQEKDIIVRDGLNSIVGENNVGKSTIFRVLDLINKKYEFSNEDYPNGSTENKLLSSVSIELNDEELLDTYENWIVNNLRNKEKKYLDKIRASIGNKFMIVLDNEQKSPLEVKMLEYNKENLTNLIGTGTLPPNFNVLRVKGDLAIFLPKLFQQKVKVFAEVRKRPGEKTRISKNH
jgi:predicted ATP-dependent endonuclease of OLD family